MPGSSFQACPCPLPFPEGPTSFHPSPCLDPRIRMDRELEGGREQTAAGERTVRKPVDHRGTEDMQDPWALLTDSHKKGNARNLQNN